MRRAGAKVRPLTGGVRAALPRSMETNGRERQADETGGRAAWRDRLRERWGTARPLIAFLAGWALLNAMANVRYPSPEPHLWYLIPSVDVLFFYYYIAL